MASFTLPRFSQPETLKAIDPEHLIAFLEPFAEYLGPHGIDLSQPDGLNYQRLIELLMHPDGAIPESMVDALYLVHECSSDDAADELQEAAAGMISFSPNASAHDVAIQVWLSNPDLLRRHHAQTVAWRQQNFFYYAGSGIRPSSMPSIPPSTNSAIVDYLSVWFAEHERGRGCTVFTFRDEHKLWIVIRHGQRVRREPSQNEDGSSGASYFRPQIHDVLIYDTTTDEIAVHAGSKGEIKLFLRAMGQFVFGRSDYFPGEVRFTLAPLADAGPDSLTCEDVDGIESVRLVELRRYWGGPYKETEIRKATDLFAAFASRRQQVGPKGTLAAATFKVKFTGSAKERSVMIRTRGNTRYERKEDSKLIDIWLEKRGFVVRTRPSIADDPAVPALAVA